MELLDLVFDLFQRQIQIASFQNKQNIFSASSFSVTRNYFAKNKWEKEIENHFHQLHNEDAYREEDCDFENVRTIIQTKMKCKQK